MGIKTTCPHKPRTLDNFQNINDLTKARPENYIDEDKDNNETLVKNIRVPTGNQNRGDIRTSGARQEV